MIDDDRISIVKKLDLLRNEVLAPRDAWEQAEKDRVENIKQIFVQLKAFMTSVLLIKSLLKLKVAS